MTDWRWNGARWWKFDLHSHTPASDDYGKGPDQKTLQGRTPTDWVLDYMRAEVDCVAVTDHNTGRWIDQLKEALVELEESAHPDCRELHLFPGMEISVNGGIHLLAIFDPSKMSSDLDALRGAVGYPGTPGRSDAVTNESFGNVVDAILSADGIAIPAHADGENGLFRLQGTTLQQALDCSGIFAMELLDRNYRKPQIYIDNKLRWTEVLGSDAHHPFGSTGQPRPGNRFTWVKMGSPSIEGLRLSLRDGQLSVRRSDQTELGPMGKDPNRLVHSVIESIEVSNGRYIGRANPFIQTMNPWFNAVIGGRGTGKSTLVEFLRIALRREGKLPEGLKQELEKYGRVYTNREEEGLLTEDAEIKVVYRKNGSRFRIQWNPASDLEPIEQEVDGRWIPAEGQIQQRFPVRIYSQKQVFQLAKTPLALLKIIDEAPEVDRHSWSQERETEENRFLSLRAKSREIEAGFAEVPRLRGELDDVKRKLKVFEQSGYREILRSFQKRSRQRRDVDIWEQSWADAGQRLREAAAEIVPDLLDGTSFDSDSHADDELKSHAAEIRNELDNIRKGVEALASEADEVVVQWRKRRSESLWKREVDAAARAYGELRENLARERAGDPAVYGELVQIRQAVEQQLRDLQARRVRIDALKSLAAACLQDLLEIRRKLTESRRRFLDTVLHGNRYVQIQVVPYGAHETVEDELRRILQITDGRFKRDIGSSDDGGLLGEIYKVSSSPYAVERGLANVKAWLKTVASGHYQNSSATKRPFTLADQRFAAHMARLPPEAMDRLDLWFPEDSLEVRYSPVGDGRRFRSIREGSPGQKTAALLAFLLSYGEEPLILDQPEDDLDNHLIYGLIVTQLREVKRRRQAIVVTHNANIVVNGDAELVLALDTRAGETQKECDGSLQERRVRETICTIMEGGREAFTHRYRRIALEDGNV